MVGGLIGGVDASLDFDHHNQPKVFGRFLFVETPF